MKIRIALTSVFALAALSLAGAAFAADGPPLPFPAAAPGEVFVVAQTVDSNGAASNYFAPGAKVIIRAYAVDGKAATHKMLTSARYFYATISGQPNVKLTHNATATGANKLYAWTGTWTVPADYPLGVVALKVLVQANHRRGSFVQMPVSSAQLTISKTGPAVFGSGPTTDVTAPSSAKVGLYMDTVNASGGVIRSVGCTQQNVFKRGEGVVVRTWGFDLVKQATLSNDNVDDAHFSLAGSADIILAYGAHGATGAKVFFWANVWRIPADYPLGDVTLHVNFKLGNGETGTIDQAVTILP
jgi:hypothetical protein